MGTININIKHQLPKLSKGITDRITRELRQTDYIPNMQEKYVLKFSKTLLEPTLNISLEIILGPEQDGPQTPFWITFYYQIESYQPMDDQKYKNLFEMEAENLIKQIK